MMRPGKVLIATAAVVLMVLSGLQMSNNAAAAQSTPASLELLWPNQSAMINETRSSSAVEAGGYARVAVAASVWDVIMNTVDGGSSNGGGQESCHRVGVGAFTSADSRLKFDYSVGSLNSGSNFNNLWSILSGGWGTEVFLSDNGGIWAPMTNTRVLYGGGYDEVYIGANGFLVLGSSKDFVHPTDPWMRGSETDRWNTSGPSIGGGQYSAPNTVIAPYWSYGLNPAATDSGGHLIGSIMYGEIQNPLGFAVVYKNILDLSNGAQQSFAVFLPRIEYAGVGTPAPGITTINEIQVHYGTITPSTYAAGMEDQTGTRYKTFSPASNRWYWCTPTEECYQAMKSVQLTYSKSKWDGSAWVPDNRAWILTSGWSGINVENQMTVYKGPSTLDIVSAGLYTLAWFTTPELTGGYLLGLGGQIVDLPGVLKDLESTSTTVTRDKKYDAYRTDASENMDLWARDEMALAWCAWDLTVSTHLNWDLDMDYAVKHKLTLTSTVNIGSIRTQSDVSRSVSSSTDIVIGPTGNPVQYTDWEARTIPDGHSVSYTDLGTISPDGGLTYHNGYRVETQGSSDYGYDFMAWNTTAHDPVNDHRVRADGSICIEGWFRMSDSLPTDQQFYGRNLMMYIMYCDENGDNLFDGPFTIDWYVPILSWDPVDTWIFKSKTVYNLVPNAYVKIAFGRADSFYGGYDGVLRAEWAGIKWYESVDGVSRYALSISTVGCDLNPPGYAPAGTTNPATTSNPRTYSYRYDAGTPVEISATPYDGNSRVGFWVVNGNVPATPGPPYPFGNYQKIVMSKDMQVNALFIPSSYRVLWTEPPVGGTVSPESSDPTLPDGLNWVVYSTTADTTVTATALSGWTFVKWVINGVDESTRNPIQIPNDDDHYVRALFSYTPQSLGATSGVRQVELDWIPGDDGTSITDYNVYRGTSASRTTKIGHTGSGATTSYIDATGEVGRTYYYQVTAVGQTGEGSKSSAVSAASYDDTPQSPLLTVMAGYYDASNVWKSLTGTVWIDSVNVGSTGQTFAVTAGTHTVEVQEPIVSKGKSYWFKEWQGGVPSGNPASISISADMTITAVYSLTSSQTYTLDIQVNDAAKGHTDPAVGAYTYAGGTAVTVTAYPNAGYVLSYWLLDGNQVSGNPYSVTMNSNHVLQAVFVEQGNTFTVTVNAECPIHGVMKPLTGAWVKIDGVVVGVTGGTFTVSAGQHLIEVEDPYLSKGKTYVFQFFETGAPPTNPGYVGVYANLVLTALYYQQ